MSSLRVLSRVRSSRRASAFTLIELLTVIAIIGILAAILIPTVGSVREKAKTIKCVGNLRAWGPAIISYANDNKGTYWISKNDGYEPWTIYDDGPNPANRYFRYFSVKRTLGQFLECPSAPAYTGSGSSADRTSYVMVQASLGTVLPSLERIPIMKATAPSRTILMMDRHFTEAGGAGTGNGASISLDATALLANIYANQYNRHGKGVNTLFMDGHVSRMKWWDGDREKSLASSPTNFNPRWFQLLQ